MKMLKRVFKDIYYTYRKLLYIICGRKQTSLFHKGTVCEVNLLDLEDNTRGDVVHPCVRYIPEGFRGHRWWMVYTPYYMHNNKLENPRLCYGVGMGQNETLAPLQWVMVEEVESGKDVGYNSDPTIIYYNRSLYIYWRENNTERTTSAGNIRATYCKVYKEDTVKGVTEPILIEKTKDSDKEMCPTFFANKDIFYCYGVDYLFNIGKWRNKQILNKIVWITGKLGIYSQAKSNGIALWKGDSLEKPFKYIETTQILNVNRLYKPWHMDFFSFEEKMYAVILTNENLGDICLAERVDGDCFRMFKHPLLTNKSVGCIELYKPTALVVQGVFYLYYTARNLDDPSLNKLYLVSCPFVELINKLGN